MPAEQKKNNNGKSKSVTTPLGSLVRGGLAGILTDIVLPSSSLAVKAVSSLLYAGVISPLVNKLFHPEAKLKELYRNSIYEGAGFLGGSYVPHLARSGYLPRLVYRW